MPQRLEMYDTNEIYRYGDLTRCLTDDLDAMDTAIAAVYEF